MSYADRHRLVTSLGFNPNVPMDLAQPTPLQQELVFAPQLPFQAPLFAGPADIYSSVQSSGMQPGPSSGILTGYNQASSSAPDSSLISPRQQHDTAIDPALFTLNNHRATSNANIGGYHTVQDGRGVAYAPGRSSGSYQGGTTPFDGGYGHGGEWYKQYDP
jgi:hypothetical protein